MRRGVTDAGQTNERTVKIELLSQWKLEAESRNYQHHYQQDAILLGGSKCDCVRGLLAVLAPLKPTAKK